MREFWRPWLLAGVLGIVHPAVASAGMPAVSFTEVSRLRLEVISFFLVGLLLSAGALQLIWYFLRRDFTWLPRLGYFGSLGIVVLWGLLFVVVLTMISGARELMTPGAWEKEGATYKLAEAEPPERFPEPSPSIAARSMQLLSLGNGLRQWAERHEGQLPSASQVTEITETLWSLPGLPGTRYLYVPDAALADQKRIIAYEPQVYDGDALALTVGGELLQLPYEELLTRVRKARAAATAPMPSAAEVAP